MKIKTLTERELRQIKAMDVDALTKLAEIVNDLVFNLKPSHDEEEESDIAVSYPSGLKELSGCSSDMDHE